MRKIFAAAAIIIACNPAFSQQSWHAQDPVSDRWTPLSHDECDRYGSQYGYPECRETRRKPPKSFGWAAERIKPSAPTTAVIAPPPVSCPSKMDACLKTCLAKTTEPECNEQCSTDVVCDMKIKLTHGQYIDAQIEGLQWKPAIKAAGK